MGYNTTILILNDALDQIEKNPEEFVAGIRDRLHLAENAPYHAREMRVGSHMNAAAVIAYHHADLTSLIAVGGNHASVIDIRRADGKHHTDEGKIAVLRNAAQALGYEIVKLPDPR